MRTTSILASLWVALLGAACGGSTPSESGATSTTGHPASGATTSTTATSSTTGGHGGGATSSTTGTGGAGAGGGAGTGGAGTGGSGGTAGTAGQGTLTAKLGAGMPQVVLLNNAMAVLSNPKVVVITYDDDANRADIEAFVPNFAQSAAWGDATGEYGVGALSAATPQHLAGNAPALTTDSQVNAMLQANLSGPNPAWGQPDTNTIYAFFFPNGAIVDDGTGSKCCTSYDGYHYSYVVGSVEVPYAIMCQCPMFDGPNVTDLQQLTVVASHELVEAVTDPYAIGNSGYAQTDDAHAVWTYVTSGEVGDMCAFADTAYWSPPDMTYMIQRTWSNKAAAAGHDPCVGAPTVPYYQAIPEQNDDVTIQYYGAWKTKGVKIAMGQTGTLKLDVYADAASGPFNVTIDDYSSVWNGGPKLLDITVPAGPFAEGDSLQATVKVLGQDASLGPGEAIVVTTSPASGQGPSTYYYGLIGQ